MWPLMKRKNLVYCKEWHGRREQTASPALRCINSIDFSTNSCVQGGERPSTSSFIMIIIINNIITNTTTLPCSRHSSPSLS